MIGGPIALNAGSVFVLSSDTGDIHLHTAEGFYAHDTRFLSGFRLCIQGRGLSPVGVGTFDSSLASFYTSSHGARGLPSGSISLARDRYVAHGLHEDIILHNHNSRTVSLRLELTFDADFADVFEVRLGRVRKAGRITIDSQEEQRLVFRYLRGDFRRQTWVCFSGQPEIKGKTATFRITLAPKEAWKTCVDILPVIDTPPPPMKCVQSVLGHPFSAYRRRGDLPLEVLRQYGMKPPLADMPKLQSDHIGIRQAYDQALADLQALRLEQDGHHILASGLPWFMAIFGRDSIISSIQTKLLGPELMVGTLHVLASLQATEVDRFRDAEPGKIPHEVRHGELSATEQVPHSRYYGSVDATPLFLVLLWEAYQSTGDTSLIHRFLPTAEAALQWIERYGDSDGDGFVEYRRRTPKGLRNQCWKDSGDSISFANGTLAEAPIAVAEVQGYVYDAKRKLADIYRTLGERKKAQRLEREAQHLKANFNAVFWMPQDGYYALALDRHKKQVNSIASNAGQCLWSGIVDADKAPQVVQRLMAPDMFSGWGIRTLSTEMARYFPLSYHNGSVWPHDTSLIAAGMARYGFTDEARELIFSLFEAIAAFPNHVAPELFAGYPRREHSVPVPYPAANAPQAWASGAVIYMLETLLGVTPAGERLLLEAKATDFSLSLAGVRYRGREFVL